MDQLKVEPLNLNYFPGHKGWGISIDEAWEETNMHSFLNAAVQDHLHPISFQSASESSPCLSRFRSRDDENISSQDRSTTCQSFNIQITKQQTGSVTAFSSYKSLLLCFSVIEQIRKPLRVMQSPTDSLAGTNTNTQSSQLRSLEEAKTSQLSSRKRSLWSKTVRRSSLWPLQSDKLLLEQQKLSGNWFKRSEQ